MEFCDCWTTRYRFLSWFDILGVANVILIILVILLSSMKNEQKVLSPHVIFIYGGLNLAKKHFGLLLTFFGASPFFFSSLAVKYHHVQLRNQSTKGIIIFHCPNFKHWKYSKVFVDVLGTFNSFQPYPKLLQLSHSALFYDIIHTTYNT